MAAVDETRERSKTKQEIDQKLPKRFHFTWNNKVILNYNNFSFRPMEWTEEKDVFMLREMLGSNVFAHKKGSPARGLAWEAIVSTLNGLESQEF